MKNLLLTLLSILTLTVYGQEHINEAEKIIFDMVNNYRVSQGLNPVKWSNEVYGAAYHHSSYVALDETPYCHSQSVDVPGHEEISDPQMRIKKYCGLYSWGTECIAGMRVGGTLGGQSINIEEECAKVVALWINSPGHKKAMLFDKEGNGDLTIGAISVVKVKNTNLAMPVLVLVNE